MAASGGTWHKSGGGIAFVASGSKAKMPAGATARPRGPLTPPKGVLKSVVKDIGLAVKNGGHTTPQGLIADYQQTIKINRRNIASGGGGVANFKPKPFQTLIQKAQVKIQIVRAFLAGRFVTGIGGKAASGIAVMLRKPMQAGAFAKWLSGGAR